MNDRDKLIEILDYCKPHLKYTWAAVIAGIILDCDFKDAQQMFRGLKNNEKIDNLVDDGRKQRRNDEI